MVKIAVTTHNVNRAKDVQSVMIAQHAMIAKTLRNAYSLLTAIVVCGVNYVLNVMIAPNVNLVEIVMAV